MSTQSDDLKKQWGITGVAIPAGLFIGMDTSPFIKS